MAHKPLSVVNTDRGLVLEIFKSMRGDFGQNFRGVKVYLAQQYGAKGVLIYSDPADDGYFRGDVYPKGPFRPESGVQRGSVQELPTRPGDPLTPDVGATADAHRLTRATAETILKIPVLPMSYGDAQQLLARNRH